LPGSPDFRSWSDFMPDLKQLIDLNFLSMGIVMVLVFGIVSLSISCAFIIYILKNLREHGIMKAMGFLPSEFACLILLQVTLLTVLASLVGTTVGALTSSAMARVGIDLTALTSHNQYFVVSGVIYPRLTAYSLCTPPLLAVIFGMLAAIWPSVFVIREKAADILRSI
jgi:ABC-type lipoprotein release transport system permease subunit